MTPGAEPARGRAAGALVLVLAMTLGAFATRLRGIDWLLPQGHLDGSIVVHQIEQLRSGDPDLGGGRFRYYPLLLAWAVAVLPAPVEADPPPAADVEEHVARCGAQWAQARSVSAALSLLLVPLTWLLARRFLPGGWPLFAAGLVATSLLLAAFGTQVRPHGLAASAILATVLGALRLRERGDVWAYLAVGVAGGAAVGALHYGVFALPPVALAFLLRRRAASGAWVVVSAVLVGAIVVACYPFHLVGRDGFLTLGEAETGTTFNLSGQELHLGLFNGAGFRVVPTTLWSFDPLLLLLTLVGVACLGTRLLRGTPGGSDRGRRADVCIVLAHAVPYTVVIGLYQNTWERFVIQLLPYFALIATFGVARVAKRLWHGRSAPATALGLVLLVPPAAACWHLGTVRSAADTYDLAADWVRDEMPDEALLAAPVYVDLPLMHAREELRTNRERRGLSSWVRYQLQLPPDERARFPRYRYLLPTGRSHAMRERLIAEPLAYLREVEADFVILQLEEGGDRAVLDSVRAAVAARGAPVWRTTSARVDDGRPAPMPVLRIAEEELARPFVRRLWQSERLGPALEIYRVPR